MHFGNALYKGSMDYSLPEDHKSLGKILGGVRTPLPKIYVGGVLWANDGFKGLIYPKNAKAADYVKYYTQQFNTIELNSTHYRMPVSETLEHWRDVAPQGFKFCPKINQTISHAPDLRKMIGFHNACATLFELLQNKLGPCFMQLPPYFSPDRLKELIVFLENSELQNLCIELRHEEWFKKEAELNLLCNFLYKNKMGLVITDTAGRRDAVHMRLTNKIAMIRFKAANEKEIDDKRIMDWILRAKEWFDEGLEEFYFFIHTSEKSDMPGLTAYFTGKLEEITGIKVQSPTIVSDNRILF